MAIIKANDVPLIPQKKDGVCWFACARMLYRWSQKTGRGSMRNPAEVEMTKLRYEANATWNAFQNGLLADQLIMKKQNFTLDFDNMNTALAKNGPIWTAGYKTWSGEHGNVVVICGVADCVYS